MVQLDHGPINLQARDELARATRRVPCKSSSDGKAPAAISVSIANPTACSTLLRDIVASTYPVNVSPTIMGPSTVSTTFAIA